MEMHPNATFVRRQGEVNAWDNAEFRAAVRATGKKQLIIGGIVTEVCKFAPSYDTHRLFLLFP
jgi:isochorismate hydrolase